MTSETSYLKDTPPSFYDLDMPWCCTIGRFEHEDAAWRITKYCQEHGDKWQPAPIGHMSEGDEMMEMSEHWLAMLQRVRVRLEGPPELIRNAKAKGGLQLRYPHGRILAASHQFSDHEMAALAQHLQHNPPDEETT